MSDKRIDANEECEVDCPSCAGDGTYETDEFSYGRNGGHYTKPHKCETCDGAGYILETVYETELREHRETLAETARLRRSLNEAHERIVQLTKQLQLRSGGDVSGAATPAVPAGQRVGTQGMASTLPDSLDGANPDGVGITLGV